MNWVAFLYTRASICPLSYSISLPAWENPHFLPMYLTWSLAMLALQQEMYKNIIQQNNGKKARIKTMIDTHVKNEWEAIPETLNPVEPYLPQLWETKDFVDEETHSGGSLATAWWVERMQPLICWRSICLSGASQRTMCRSWCCTILLPIYQCADLVSWQGVAATSCQSHSLG